MDATDRHLLELLQANGRTTQLELAKEIKLSQPATAERIRKLEERTSGPVCGNGAREGLEACDKTDLAERSIFNFYS